MILLLHIGTYEKRWGVCTVAQQPAASHSLFKKRFLVLVDKFASVGTSHRKESQTRFTKTLVMHWLIIMGWKLDPVSHLFHFFMYNADGDMPVFVKHLIFSASIIHVGLS